MDTYPVGAETGMIKEIQTMASVGKINPTGTTYL